MFLRLHKKKLRFDLYQSRSNFAHLYWKVGRSRRQRSGRVTQGGEGDGRGGERGGVMESSQGQEEEERWEGNTRGQKVGREGGGIMEGGQGQELAEPSQNNS